MKKTNKKGFTIVELVIVIAVIAILAAVLIPTFSGVVTKAKQSSALQAARNTTTEYLASLDGEHFPTSINLIVKGADDMYFAVVNGTTNTTVYATSSAAEAAFTGGTVATAPAASPFNETVLVVTITPAP